MSVLDKDKNHCYYKIFYKNVYIHNVNIIYNDRIDISEAIDVNKTNA